MAPDLTEPHGSPAFVTTRWSVVLAARDGEGRQARDALAALCASYWYPLYAYLRRQGEPADHAADLTQAFFARMLDRGFLELVDREKGRFRAYLLACLRHFLSNERDHARAQKRGGGRTPLPLDFERAERRFSLEPAHELTAEKLYLRRFALELLEQVLGRLRAEYAGQGKEALFEATKQFITADEPRPQREVGSELGLSEGAVRVAVHRLRRRYAEALRAEIACTVEDPAEIDDELRQLMQALSNG